MDKQLSKSRKPYCMHKSFEKCAFIVCISYIMVSADILFCRVCNIHKHQLYQVSNRAHFAHVPLCTLYRHSTYFIVVPTKPMSLTISVDIWRFCLAYSGSKIWRPFQTSPFTDAIFAETIYMSDVPMLEFKCSQTTRVWMVIDCPGAFMDLYSATCTSPLYICQYGTIVEYCQPDWYIE